MFKGRRWVIIGSSVLVIAVAATGVNAAVSYNRAATPSTVVLDPPIVGGVGATDSPTNQVTPNSPTPGPSETDGAAQTDARATPSTAPTGTDRLSTTEPAAEPPKAPTAGTGEGSDRSEESESSGDSEPSGGAEPSGAVGSKPGTGRIRLGTTYRGVATFYNASVGVGNCSFDPPSNLMVGAMNQVDYENSQACGAFLEVTGPNGAKVTIRVIDRCPECPVGAIDLSQEAFAKLAPASAGEIDISWKLLSPASASDVSYRYKSGSSRFWCAIQVLNHRNPIRSLEVQVGDEWRALNRQTYNYFESFAGNGCGNTLRVTDIYGGQITQTGITISPDQVQGGNGQFGAPV